jgi:hypothetical protein
MSADFTDFGIVDSTGRPALARHSRRDDDGSGHRIDGGERPAVVARNAAPIRQQTQ